VSLYQILQILSVTLFEKTPILRALQASDYENDFGDPDNQLILFDFQPDTSVGIYLCPHGAGCDFSAAKDL
jgi:hypothetical protein